MIRHILLFKFNEGVPAEVRDDAINRLQALGEQCPTVSSWSVGANQADSKTAYDVAEVADFVDEDALNTYKAHPAHRQLSAHLGTIASWALVDHRFTPEVPASAAITREYASSAYRALLEQRGNDPLLHANAEETRQRMMRRGFPVDNPEFVADALIGALTVHQKVESQAFLEIDQGSSGMSEVTRASGQMTTGAVIELGIMLENLTGSDVASS